MAGLSWFASRLVAKPDSKHQPFPKFSAGLCLTALWGSLRLAALLGSLCLAAPHAISAAASGASNPSADPWQAARQAGAIILFRHANAPGVGDPSGFNIKDCATQRNLDEAGRAQARAIGAALKRQGVQVGAAFASQWCRTLETARLAVAPLPVREEPSFNSFFQDRGVEPTQTEAALKVLRAWRGPGTLVVVTHQVNISALTGVFTASGEGVVLGFSPTGAVEVRGRLATQ